MALPPRGLFSPNLDINNLIRQQQKAELSKMDRLKDPGRYYQKQIGNQVTNAVRSIGQALGGASPDSAAGMLGSYIQQDKALGAEVQRRKDRDEMMEMFKETNMDSPEDFYNLANVMRGKGYFKEASQLMEQGHGFKRLSQEDKKIELKGLSLENIKENLAGQLALGYDRLDFDKINQKDKNKLATEQFKFQKWLGVKTNKREDFLARLKKWSEETGFDLEKEGLDNAKEAALRDYTLNKEQFKEEMGLRKWEGEINKNLKKRQIDISEKTLEQKEDLFYAQLKQEKVLGLEGLSLEKQKIKLKKEIHAFNKKLNVEKMDLEKLSVKHLQEYRLKSLENDITKEKMKIKYDALQQRSKDLSKTVNKISVGNVNAILNKSESLMDKFNEVYDVGKKGPFGGRWFADIDNKNASMILLTRKAFDLQSRSTMMGSPLSLEKALALALDDKTPSFAPGGGPINTVGKGGDSFANVTAEGGKRK